MVRNLIRRMNLFQGQEEGPKYRLALDIGTEYVKAIYIEMDGTNSKVIGVGRARQDYADMENGAVASISGVTCCCRQAITQGSIVAGVKPTEVVIGLAGQFVHGIARTIEKQRIKPDRPITLPELEMFVKEAQKEALKDVMESIIQKLNYPKMDIELVHSSLVSITIDGYPVTNPLDFHGRNLELTIFMTFAPLVHASAMRTIAGRLGLDLLGLVAEPYAVASSSLTDEAYEFGSLVIDIGGGSTDIALIQKRGITGVKMMAMGGRAFTKG
ncbi:MAG: cell division protein FtsA, partial [Firmicutes bacterium]|nr:cell division protein FtsA [Bacillota bacterium]